MLKLPSLSKIQLVPMAVVRLGSRSPQGKSCMLVLRLYGEGLMVKSRFLLYITLSATRRLPGGYALNRCLLSTPLSACWFPPSKSLCFPIPGTVLGCNAGDTALSIEIGPKIFSNFKALPALWYIWLFLSKSLSRDRILLLKGFQKD